MLTNSTTGVGLADNVYLLRGGWEACGQPNASLHDGWKSTGKNVNVCYKYVHLFHPVLAMHALFVHTLLVCFPTQKCNKDNKQRTTCSYRLHGLISSIHKSPAISSLQMRNLPLAFLKLLMQSLVLSHLICMLCLFGDHLLTTNYLI